MDDLIKRLRARGVRLVGGALRHEAADRIAALQARIAELEAERDRLREALLSITKATDKIIWGEDWEVRRALGVIEDLAIAALKEGDT